MEARSGFSLSLLTFKPESVFQCHCTDLTASRLRAALLRPSPRRAIIGKNISVTWLDKPRWLRRIHQVLKLLGGPLGAADFHCDVGGGWSEASSSCEYFLFCVTLSDSWCLSVCSASWSLFPASGRSLQCNGNCDCEPRETWNGLVRKGRKISW